MISKFTLRRSAALAAFVAAVSLTGCQKEELMENQFVQPQADFTSQNGQAIEGQYIVVFKNGGSAMSASSNQGLKATKVEAAMKRERVLNVSKVDAREVSQVYEGVVNGFAARLSPEQLDALRKNPEVAYVEQDRIIALAPSWLNKAKAILKKYRRNRRTSEPAPTQPIPINPEPTPTEPEPLPATTEPAPVEPEPTVPTPSEPVPGYASFTPLAGESIPWNIELVGYGDGTGKTVWVIDSGIDTDHSDLNIDVSRSFSFIYGNPSIEDGFGHGTSVAGVIAAKNNGSGMIGVAANATVVALRVFDDAGAGTVSRAISAVNHVSNNGKAGDVVNMSLGSGISSTLDNAVMNAASKGILFAIAAGNSAVDCSGSSPARVNAPGVYTISAMDSYSKLWASSNFGAGVDFAAPGVNVTALNKTGSFSSGHYGTSLAAPHVAGILALRGEVLSQGYITGDKDATPDPIASVK